MMLGNILCQIIFVASYVQTNRHVHGHVHSVMDRHEDVIFIAIAQIVSPL